MQNAECRMRNAGPKAWCTSRGMKLTPLLVLAACGAASTPQDRTPEPCETSARLAQGGEFFDAQDGVRLWFRTAGRQDAPTLVFLHGGPGYNTYTFERSAGVLLEQRFRLVYVDQRGAGRSGFDGDANQYGMNPTAGDIDALLQDLQIERTVLIGHSFGAVVAAAYAHRYPQRVAGVVFVDGAPNVGSALSYQVERIDTIADRVFPDNATAVHEIARAPETPFTKLGALYGLLGRLAVQRNLHFATSEAQDSMEQMDAESGFLACTSAHTVGAFVEEGYLSEARPDVAVRLSSPSLLIAGRQSHVIGPSVIEQAAATWGSELVWVENAGHFVYFEQATPFVTAVRDFVATL